MKLKTLLILSASAMLSAAVIASDVALAQPIPGPPAGGPPPSMAGGGLAGPGGPPGGWARTGAFGLAPNSHCDGYATAPQSARRDA